MHGNDRLSRTCVYSEAQVKHERLYISISTAVAVVFAIHILSWISPLRNLSMLPVVGHDIVTCYHLIHVPDHCVTWADASSFYVSKAKEMMINNVMVNHILDKRESLTPVMWRMNCVVAPVFHYC